MWKHFSFVITLQYHNYYADHTRIVWQSFVEAWTREVCGTFPGAWNNSSAWVYQLQEALGPVQQCGQSWFLLSDLSRGGSCQVPSKYCTYIKIVLNFDLGQVHEQFWSRSFFALNQVKVSPPKFLKPFVIIEVHQPFYKDTVLPWWE